MNIKYDLQKKTENLGKVAVKILGFLSHLEIGAEFFKRC